MFLVPDFNLALEQPLPLANELAYLGVNDEEQRFRLDTDKNQKLVLGRSCETTVEKDDPAGRQA